MYLRIAREFLVSVMLTVLSYLARYERFIWKLALTMTADAFARRAHVKRICVPIIPLAVQIISHIHNVVDDRTDSVNGKGLEVPV